jgi:hypothetical protein
MPECPPAYVVASTHGSRLGILATGFGLLAPGF